MFICICRYIYIYTYLFIYIYIYIYLYLYLDLHLHLYLYLYLYLCVLEAVGSRKPLSSDVALQGMTQGSTPQAVAEVWAEGCAAANFRAIKLRRRHNEFCVD